MAQSMLTKNLGNVQQYLFSRPSLSANTMKTTTQKIVEYLSTGSFGVQYSKDAGTLRNALREKKEKILKEMKIGEKESFGTRNGWWRTSGRHEFCVRVQWNMLFLIIYIFILMFC
ncbi:hypothetical protein WA026_006355 [Henosepilachna vigintioctopunctata]|uniref:Uncharacterized protein n=1 Tax=Henosepilachna vigintioctopunctata TaxID=420089 RepID=A0AAW1TI82_9CUCU